MKTLKEKFEFAGAVVVLLVLGAAYVYTVYMVAVMCALILLGAAA